MAKKIKKRIYEYAKELNINNADLMQRLKFMGIRVSNIFNAVDEDTIHQIKRQMGLHLFEDIEPEPAAPPAPRKKTVPPPQPGKDAAPTIGKKPEPPKTQPAQPPQAARPTQPTPSAPPPAPPRPTTQKPQTLPPRPVQPSTKPGQPAQKPQTPHAPPAGKKPTAPLLPPRAPSKKKQEDRRSDPNKLKPKKPEIKTGADETPLPKKADYEDIYTSPSKRLEAIKAKGLQQKERRGTKTTFIKKRFKKDKRDKGELDELELPPAKKRIKVTGPMTVKELAHELGAKSSDIIMYLMKELSLMTTLNQSLDFDIITLVTEHLGATAIIDTKAPKTDEDEETILAEKEEEVTDFQFLETRPPVVTVLGHVDHGKTKLLDAIRHTDVVATEFGGITQHIGAYQVTHNNRKITFLDTPGHAAFTQLRARGAKVTDLAVLVVAADDGVMPQTLEAIDHAKEAGVPILVAVNKIDKSNATPDRVRQQLSDKGLIPEEWGGQTVFVEISAKMKTNIEELLEMIFLVTDLLELKSNPKRKAVGTVIEAKLDKGKGPVATVLVQNGTLYTGDYVVAGGTYGKLRAMENDRGERVPFAGPSMPIEVHGLHEVPEAGDKFFVIEDEKTAKEIAAKRSFKTREEKLHYEGRISLEDLFKRIQQDKLKELKIVLKGDVQGSVEAITQSLEGIKHEQVRINVIRADVGDIKETDIMLAAAADAIVMGYNVNIIPDAQAQSNSENVEVRFYEIIYKLIEDVKRAMAGMLAPEYDEVFTGKAEVRQLFASSKHGTISGSYVLEGEIAPGHIAKVIRDGKEVYKSKLGSLKRFKDNVKSVTHGYECGIIVDGFGDTQVGDIVECYKLVEKKHETI